MAEIIETAVSIAGNLYDLYQSPVARAFVVAMGYQAMVGRARDINTIKRVDEKHLSRGRHAERCKKYTSKKLRHILDDIWYMTDEMKKTLPYFGDPETGRRKIYIKQNKQDIEAYLDKYPSDYFEQARKVLFERMRKPMIADFEVKANSFKTLEEREEYVNEYSIDFRKDLISNIHRGIGYNDDVISLCENEYLTYDHIRSIVTKILTEVEKSINIRDAEERRYKKEYSVKTLDVFKITKSVFQRRRL